MIKTLYTLILLMTLAVSAHAQIVSKFVWDANPVTQAAIGPNATSAGLTATSSTGGVGGTNGLNPGTGSHDLNVVVPGSVFMLAGLDISMDFRREENGASFFTLGSLDFGINTGAPYAKFLLKKGAADTLVSLNNILNIPSDNAFHTLRYIYNNSTGVFTASVDGTVMTTYNGVPGRALSWTGATNAIIGSGMDGSNNNVPVLDNFIAQVPAVVLPLQLLSFDARAAGSSNDLSWTTTSEVNVRDFSIERSTDGVRYASIGIVAAQSGYSTANRYDFTDNTPAAVNYYRLKMTDQDGNFSYSPIRKLNGASAAVTISCYPNPVINTVNVRVSNSSAVYQYVVTSMDGKLLQAGLITGQQASIDLGSVPKGLVIVRVENVQNENAQTFKLFKQ